MTFCEIDLDEVGAEYINETKKDWFKIREDDNGIPYLSRNADITLSIVLEFSYNWNCIRYTVTLLHRNFTFRFFHVIIKNKKEVRIWQHKKNKGGRPKKEIDKKTFENVV